MKKPDFWLAVLLVPYLLVLGVGSAIAVIVNFPDMRGAAPVFPMGDGTSSVFLRFENIASADQGFILLAMLSGLAGSFLHTAQSLSSYVGNGSFRASWALWYFFRPWIGAILGLAIYFAFRAGLVAGSDGVNPYGVVAIGSLSGWFSKTATDKLQQVFETLFTTDEDKRRNDKLLADKPILEAVLPSPVAVADNEIKLMGNGFREGASVLVGGQELPAQFVSGSELKLSLSQLPNRPTGKVSVSIRVKNPVGHKPLSDDRAVIFK